jgi:aminoglycoside phosphotransferase (APT) family kinase protein
MHDDEVDTDSELVRRLFASQHRRWAELPIERVLSARTDNVIYRLGDELAVRLPRDAERRRPEEGTAPVRRDSDQYERSASRWSRLPALAKPRLTM